MKKILTFMVTLSLLCFAMYSCDDSASKEEGDKDGKVAVDTDFSDFKGESLKKHGINALLMLPDETSNTGASVVPNFIRPDDRLWLVEMGPRFEMEIEDLGSEKDALTRIKTQLEDLGVYTIKYIIDEPNLIMYERALKYTDNSDLEVKKAVTYHCAGVTEINGITYVMRSGKADVGFPKLIIEDMVKTIRSFEPLKN